ncbi:MAG: histidine phosphatase family protein [Gammaproteobacteria bacterium]|nr:histidine phosphatase family protein [Gammaproteobacteria bacterium]
MSRELLILRHAKSAWDTDVPTDFERPLAKRGKKDAPKMGKWLRQQNLMPDTIISSPAVRAKQTVIKACREMGIDKEQVHWDPRIYEAGTQSLLEVLAACPPDAKRVLLTGHNPGVESLVMHLCGTELRIPEDGKLLPTAALAYLKMPADWKHLESGSASLVSITRVRNIPDWM